MYTQHVRAKQRNHVQNANNSEEDGSVAVAGVPTNHQMRSLLIERDELT